MIFINTSSVRNIIVLLFFALNLSCFNFIQVTLDKASFAPCADSQLSRVINLPASRVNLITEEIEDQNGERGLATVENLKNFSVRFPACYSLKFRLEFDVDFTQPYFEIFVNINGQLICSKLAENGYCRESQNDFLRRATAGKVLCKFCNICVYDLANYKKRRATRDAEQGPNLLNLCHTTAIKANQLYELTLGPICTSTANSESIASFINSDNFWKQFAGRRIGTVVFILHILNRYNPIDHSCLVAEEGYSDQRLGGTEKMTCDTQTNEYPEDAYRGCYLGTMEYSVYGLH